MQLKESLGEKKITQNVVAKLKDQEPSKVDPLLFWLREGGIMLADKETPNTKASA